MSFIHKLESNNIIFINILFKLYLLLLITYLRLINYNNIG
jgi:hypothetical protein